MGPGDPRPRFVFSLYGGYLLCFVLLPARRVLGHLLPALMVQVHRSWSRYTWIFSGSSPDGLGVRLLAHLLPVPLRHGHISVGCVARISIRKTVSSAAMGVRMMPAMRGSRFTDMCDPAICFEFFGLDTQGFLMFVALWLTAILYS